MKKISTRILSLLLLAASLMLVTVPGSIAEPVIYLVRHAEQTDQSEADPHLSGLGEARAIWFAGHFSKKEITTIYSSPYFRTRETAEPLAGVLGLEVLDYNPRELAAFAEELKGQEGIIFVAGHSNTTPALVNELTGRDYFKQLQHFQFDHIFRVSWDEEGEARVELTYATPRSVYGDHPSEK